MCTVYLLLVTLILPLACFAVEMLMKRGDRSDCIGKWFIFWAIGIRCLVAGIVQLFSPGFGSENTAEASSFIYIQELGLANCCFGICASISIFLPKHRLYMTAGAFSIGMAAILHFFRSGLDAGISFDEKTALISDICVLALLLSYYALLALRKYDTIKREQSLL